MLYVVATPIGNLEDISPRALDVLKEKANIIFAEDTRVTKKLLARYDIHTPVQRLDAYTEARKADDVIDIFDEWGTVALVSDSGTPTISDPGFRFVAAVRKAKIPVVAIPGPSAITTALSVSGASADQFLFLGFLPHKKGRETLFKEIAESNRTVVFYESPHRILKSLSSLAKHCGEKKVVIARELTKIHEEVLSGTAEELIKILEVTPVKQKGEFTVIVSH